MVLAIGMASTGLAQAQVVIGGKPDVEVDATVLDQLGPPSNLPGLLLGQTSADSGKKIILTPPKSLRGKGKRHHGAKGPAAETEPGIVHLHPIGRHPHHRAAKTVKEAPAKEAAPAPAPSEAKAIAPPTLASVPSPAPAPAPAPVKAAPMALTPTPPPAPAPAAPPAAGTPMALTAQSAAPSPPAAPAAAAEAPRALATIAFEKDSARLPDGAKDTLAHLASHMTEDAALEVQLLAYAAGDEENASRARRLSLSRALMVRSFLIDQGVRSTRIEVRALGNKVPEGPPDRVDIVTLKRG